MRRPTRIAVVTEGPGDFLVVRAIINSLAPEADVVPVHPDVPVAAYPEYAASAASGVPGAGWRGVKAWCEEYGDTLDLFMGSVVGDEYTALIIHVDTAMADKVGAERPRPPARATTDALRAIITGTWLNLDATPPFVVLATPSKCTDTWVVAALGEALPQLECDFAVENVLVRKRRFRRREGEVKKPRRQYEPLARLVAAKWSEVCAVCTEAERLQNELSAAL
jgi:hypothetical protein